MLSFFLCPPMKQIMIITIILIIVMAVFPLNIDPAIQQVNTQNVIKDNTSSSVQNHSVALTNNTRVAVNASKQNQTVAEIEIAPNTSATLVLNNQTSIDLTNPLQSNKNIGYIPSQCCQPCQRCEHNNRELSDKLEDIGDSINQLRTSFDNSTGFSIIGLVSGLAAIALSILLPYWYEKAKRPYLVVQTADPSQNHTKFLHGKVVNMSHRPGFGNWFGIETNPAVNTRAEMEFFKSDSETPIPNLPNEIPAKWVSAPEPLTHDRKEFDSTKLALLYRETITSGDEEAFDVVIKHRDDGQYDAQCYVVTGDNYQFGKKGILRNDTFRIDERRFRVKIHVNSGSSYETATFFITNGTDFDHFTMSTTPPTDTAETPPTITNITSSQRLEKLGGSPLSWVYRNNQ
jgi:hypothetical protein